MPHAPQPPQWIQRFFRWYCNLHHQEHLEGDLFELFERRVPAQGLRQARIRYFLDVLDLIRPFTLRRQPLRPAQPFIYSDMLFHHLKTAFRNLRRHYAFTSINVLGLTLGLLVAMVIFIKVGHDLNFDRDLPGVDRLYRIVAQQSDRYYTGMPGPIPEKLALETPGIESLSIIDRNFGVMTVGIPQPDGLIRRIKEEDAARVWPEHFSVFEATWIAGDPATALAQPHTAVITRSRALDYFGTLDVLGKTLETDDTTALLITGLIQDPPLSTNFPFHLLISRASERVPAWMANQWHAFAGQFQAFVRLNLHTEPRLVEQRMNDFLARNMPGEPDDKYALYLQPVREMHLDTRYGSFSKPIVAPATLWALALAAVFLLLSGCINFVNINLALVFQRAKEMGMRKVLGSGSGQIFRALLLETAIVLLLSFVVALLLVPPILEKGSFLIGESLSISLLSELNLWGYLSGLFALTVLLAGFYPALLMARINPIQAMKNKLDHRYGRGISLRKGLLTLQFAISQTLIICMIIAMNQMDYFHSTPLGFDQSAVVEVEMPTEDPQQLKRIKTRLAQESGIRTLSFSNTGAASDNYWKYNFSYFPGDSAPETKGFSHIKMVDDSYLLTYGIELLAGNDFPRWDSLPYALINERLLSEIGLDKPLAALGKQIMCGGKDYEIRGVVRDFNTQSLHSAIEPVIILPSLYNTQVCGIKVQGDRLREVLAHVESVWTDEFPENVFAYQFLDESIAAFYEREERATRLFQAAAGIAILIGILGMLGLVSLAVARRTKEIGIRKVLGAGIAHILSLFTREFVLIVCLGFLVAGPVAAYVMQGWLEDFAYRVAIRWDQFAIAFLISLCVMLLVVFIKSYRAATMNPVDAIRDE